MTWTSDHLCLWRHISIDSKRLTLIFHMKIIWSMKIIFVQQSTNRKFWPSRRFSHGAALIINNSSTGQGTSWCYRGVLIHYISKIHNIMACNEHNVLEWIQFHGLTINFTWSVDFHNCKYIINKTVFFSQTLQDRLPGAECVFWQFDLHRSPQSTRILTGKHNRYESRIIF